MNSLKKYLAEMIGTFVLVVFGCGTACLVGCDAANGSGYILTALAFGLVIVAMAYSIGNISGCHINPAVSLGVWLTGGMKLVDFIGYVVAQCIGAITGGAFLVLVFNGKEGEALYDQTGGLGSNGLAGVGDSWLIGLIVEVVLTFVFVLAILGVTSKAQNGRVAGIVIGLTLTLVHILGIGLTGTSVNP
ncbi:MAG: aquaporin, partial [Clostridia bacterium]|nr:aquaporin [Clostridia bacterium]